MRNLKFLIAILMFYCPAVLAQELPQDFSDLKTKVLATVNVNFDESVRLLDGYLNKHKDMLDQKSLQAFYHFYAKMLFIHRDYQASVDMLKKAIDQYESDTEPYLVATYEDYKKYLNKPKLKTPLPNDQKSCEALNGIWHVSPTGSSCNLPTADKGKKCSDSTECQGVCEVDKSVARGTKITGQCSERLYSESGCSYAVTNGIANGGLCS